MTEEQKTAIQAILLDMAGELAEIQSEFSGEVLAEKWFAETSEAIRKI